MVFKRIRRVTRAEKKWLDAVKQELQVYYKKRYFQQLKINAGLEKLEKARKERIMKKVIKKLNDNMQRHILDQQIAKAFRNKFEKTKLLEYWHSETKRVLKTKENERKAKHHYENKLKSD